MNIGIDLDQVLGDFTASFDAFNDDKYNTNLAVQRSNQFYLRDIFNITEEEELKRVEEFYASKYFLKIKPFPDSIKAIKELSKRHNLFLITSRPDFVETQTKAWIEKHYPNCFKEIFLTGHHFGGKKKKFEICLDKKIDLMIEDMAFYANEIAEVGVKCILIERPWNKKEEIHHNITRVKNWDEIVSLIENPVIQ